MAKLLSLLAHFALAVAATVASPTTAKAIDPATLLGRQLNQQELSQIHSQPKVRVGEETYTVYAPRAAPDTEQTFVVDRRGIVGLCKHEVIVTRATAKDVALVVSLLKAPPAVVRTVDPEYMTILRFKTFHDSAAGVEALAWLLPRAKVDLPMQFSLPSRSPVAFVMRQ